MTHDFAQKPKDERRQSSRRKKPKGKSHVPGWVWLFTGIVTGVFISFLGFLAGITPQSAPATQKDIASQKNTPPAVEKKNTTRFDFYTLLPEREVIVPIEHGQQHSKPEEIVHYILQAGSFKNAADADRLRAKLIILGLETKVDSVTGASGDTWHRVQVGPFVSRSKLSKARDTLINEGIETLLLKRKLNG